MAPGRAHIAGRAERKSEQEPRKSAERRQVDWSAEEKLAAVVQARGLSEAELGAFLRREGLHEAQLREWQQSVESAALDSLRGNRKTKASSAETKRIKELERELRRKEKTLAETAALLVLRKKSGRSVGGRGRVHRVEERRRVLDLISEAVSAGARQSRACGELGLHPRTVQRWATGTEDQRRIPKRVPHNRIGDAQREGVISLLQMSVRTRSEGHGIKMLAGRAAS